MTTHSSTLAWKIPWMKEPGRLQSMWSQRVRNDFTFTFFFLCGNMGSQVAQMVKNLPGKQEIRVWSLGREDLLEKEMATHSSIFAWKIPRLEEPGRLQSMGSKRLCSQFLKNSNHFIWENPHGQRSLADYSP